MNRNMKAITWGLEVRGLDPGPWRLLMVLCAHVGKRNYDVWPSFARMAEKAEISRASAKRFVAVLIERGFIVQADSRWRENGGRSVNVYRIMVGEIDTADVGPDEEDQYLDAADPRVNMNRGQGHSYDPAPRVTGDLCSEPLKEGTSIIEDSPLSLTGETPPSENLFGDQGVVTALPSIIAYVEERWEKLCVDFPRTHRIMVMSDSRKNAIARRAGEIVKGAKGAFTAYQVWDMMFDAIRGDRWLRGEAESTRDYPTPFALDIDYILRPKVFARTLEKASTNDRDIAATSDPHTGREFGPAEQAARGALARFLAGQQQRQ